MEFRRWLQDQWQTMSQQREREIGIGPSSTCSSWFRSTGSNVGSPMTSAFRHGLKIQEKSRELLNQCIEMFLALKKEREDKESDEKPAKKLKAGPKLERKRLINKPLVR